MTTYVVDSSAWVEYFSGSDSGKKVAEVVDDEKHNVLTTVVTIAELASFFKKEDKDFEEPYGIILKNSKIVYLNEEIAKEAGRLHAEVRQKNKKFSFADSFVLFAAKKHKARIITKDFDFKGYKEALFI